MELLVIAKHDDRGHSPRHDGHAGAAQVAQKFPFDIKFNLSSQASGVNTTHHNERLSGVNYVLCCFIIIVMHNAIRLCARLVRIAVFVMRARHGRC